MRSIALVGSLAALFVSAPLAAQIKTSDVIRGLPIPGTVLDQDQRQTRNSDHIPPGQLPPAGMCRIWIDGVPPGHQPAPTDCQTAVATKPANARVIWGDQSAFPGKGKGKANKANKAKHDDRDDDDDDEINANRRPTVPGQSVSSTSKSKGKGRGHGKG